MVLLTTSICPADRKPTAQGRTNVGSATLRSLNHHQPSRCHEGNRSCMVRKAKKHGHLNRKQAEGNE